MQNDPCECFRGCEVGESRNTPLIHSSVLREYRKHHLRRKGRNAKGSQGLCDLCRAPQRGLCWEKIHTKMRESTAAASVEGGMWELFAGEWSSKSQPVTKTEKKKLCGLVIQGESVLSAPCRNVVYGLLHPKEESRDPGQ